ncbi:MAG: hypothetical protein AAFN74_27605 [Myxococcota bacterium]
MSVDERAQVSRSESTDLSSSGDDLRLLHSAQRPDGARYRSAVHGAK